MTKEKRYQVVFQDRQTNETRMVGIDNDFIRIYGMSKARAQEVCAELASNARVAEENGVAYDERYATFSGYCFRLREHKPLSDIDEVMLS